MKKKSRRLIPIIAVMVLVFIYQLYWLVDQYDELSQRLNEDIQEVLRSSDFEELAHRVDEISRMKYEGRVDVSVGYDNEDKNKKTTSSVSDKTSSGEDGGTAGHTGQHMVVSPAAFANVLKNPEDLVEIGLNMQRGIHASLDDIKEVDMAYLDKVITGKLDSLGLDTEHRLLYLRKNTQNGTKIYKVDTIAKFGTLSSGTENTFTLKLSPDAEYTMAIPQWRLAVLKKMLSAILFSAFTFAILIVAFWRLNRLMHIQKQLETIKEDFTNNITHELKTPIAVAYAANDALLNFDTESNTPRMNRYLTICQQQLRLLDRLVEQILSLSMERNNKPILNIEEISVDNLINALVENFKIKYPGKVSFDVKIQQNLTIRSDFMHLSNIVGNLIDNAIKYSPSHASVTISAFLDNKDCVVIKVKDCGIGISNEQQKLVFDKFYRVPHGNKHDVKGYGLGLFYVKSMTEKLDGTISVKSSLGKGSAFTLKFLQTGSNNN